MRAGKEENLNRREQRGEAATKSDAVSAYRGRESNGLCGHPVLCFLLFKNPLYYYLSVLTPLATILASYSYSSSSSYSRTRRSTIGCGFATLVPSVNLFVTGGKMHQQRAYCLDNESKSGA
jgi:hypothetical protein